MRVSTRHLFSRRLIRQIRKIVVCVKLKSSKTQRFQKYNFLNLLKSFVVITIFVVVRVQSIIFAYLKYFCKNNARHSNFGSGYNVPAAIGTLKVYRKT